MDTYRTLLLLLHIPSAALLFGANTGVIRNLRQNLKLGKDAFRIATADGSRKAKLVNVSSMVTLATGVGLIMLMGGMKHAPLNYHIALGLMLAAIGVSAIIMSPTHIRLSKLAQADGLNADAVSPLIKKLAMGQGISHLLWVAMLVMMLVRIYK